MVEKIQTQSTPEDTSPEGHVEAMVKKVDDAVEALQPAEGPSSDTDTPDPSTETERPEWLPEKFKSPEDMAKAYKELETKLGKPEASDEVSTSDDKATEEQAQAAVEEAGLDFDALQKEFDANGELSEDTLKDLEKAKIPSSMVDAYIAGQKAIAEAQVAQIYNLTGGEDGYKDMATWMRQTLAPGEIEAFDASLDQSVDIAKIAIQGMYARYTADNGAEPKLIGGTTTGSASASFQSRQELTAAMKDPRYAKDPAYQEDVKRRLANSNIF
jgi:hypothetical protein